MIPPIVKRLKELKKKVTDILRTSPLRLFSTSLLVVSEGCLESHRASQNTTGKTNSDGEEDEEEEEEDEDEEYSYSDDHDDCDSLITSSDFDESSTQSLCDVQAKAQGSSTKITVTDSNGNVVNNKESGPYSHAINSKAIHCTRDHRIHRHHHRRANKPMDNNNSGFDVRMIDFAHTSFSSNSSSDGFLLGLDNLIRMLNDICCDNQPRLSASSILGVVNGQQKRRRSSSHAENVQPTLV